MVTLKQRFFGFPISFSKTQSRKANSGFTLIELLVVVAIIAVLIAMLLPALNSARAQAKQIACSSNFRQFGIMYNMYAADHNGYLCPPESRYIFPPASDPNYPYPLLMRNYLKDPLMRLDPWSFMSGITWGGTSILQCASNTAMMRYVWQPHYAMNVYPFYPSIATTKWLKEDSIKEAARVMLLMDWKQSLVMPPPSANLYNNAAYYNDTLWGDFHKKGMNFLYYDGHSSWYAANKLKGQTMTGDPPWCAQP